jgi:hypothetical protein
MQWMNLKSLPNKQNIFIFSVTNQFNHMREDDNKFQMSITQNFEIQKRVQSQFRITKVTFLIQL